MNSFFNKNPDINSRHESSLQEKGKHMITDVDLKIKTKKNRFILLNYLIIVCIVILSIYIIYDMYLESNIKTISSDSNYLATRINSELNIPTDVINNTNVNSSQEYFGNFLDNSYDNQLNISDSINSNSSNRIIDELIDSEYLGYPVDCKLSIPSISLETLVLSEYTETSSEICVSKFWGPEPNTVGNYSIAGHNYISPNMFKNLSKLNIGAEIYLSDNTNGTFIYEIYDIFKVHSSDTSVLESTLPNTREITLITCVNYTDYRLIIKAIEIP